MIANAISLLQRGSSAIIPVIEYIWNLIDTNWELRDTNWDD